MTRPPPGRRADRSGRPQVLPPCNCTEPADSCLTPYGRPGGPLLLASIAHVRTRLPGLRLFWIALVLTRALGATVGDPLTKAEQERGVGLGTHGASAVFVAILALAPWRESQAEAGRTLSRTRA